MPLIGVVLGVVAVIALVLAVRGALLMVTWNWVMPAVFGLPHLSFMEAVGVVLVTIFLFGNVFDRNSLNTTKVKNTNVSNKA